MKRIFILLFITTWAALAAHAVLNDEVNTRWTKLLDAMPPDMGNCVIKTDNSLFFLSQSGSTIGDGGSGWPKEYTDPTASIYYDGEVIATGAPYEGSSYNLNFNLIKTDLDGHLQWCVYSTCGEVTSNDNKVVPAPDGGVFVSLLMRHTLNMRTTKPSFTDATGQVTTIDWTLEDENADRYYRGILMKVSIEGAIEWIRLIDADTAPQPNATGSYADGTWQALYMDGMTYDDEGNFYVSGRYVNPITFHGESESTTITPHNTEGWSGNSQESVGDLFIAKFDSNGYLVDVFTTTGKCDLETMPVMAWTGEDIILNAIVKGTGNETDAIALDGHEVALPTSYQCLLTARMTSDFKVKWVRLFSGDKIGSRSTVMQYNHVNVIGDNLWLTGMGNFTLYSDDNSDTIATVLDNVREGYIIKCDLNDGSWQAATTSRNAWPSSSGITGFLGGFESEDYFYTYGYSMGGDMGVFLAEFDKNTLEQQQYCTLVKGGSMTTANEMVASDNTLYTICRVRETTVAGYELQTINNPDTIHTLLSMQWAAMFSAFDLPFTVLDRESNAITGDVDASGEVNISDINVIINIILGGEADAETLKRADINGDQEITISDVNGVIDIILD